MATGTRLSSTSDTCKLYELYALHRDGTGWAAAQERSGTSARTRSARGWTSADAAGLPILPGFARGAATPRPALIRPCAPLYRRADTQHVPLPARHESSRPAIRRCRSMGWRVRSKANVDISHAAAGAHRRDGDERYGTILADNGSSWLRQRRALAGTGRTTSWTPRPIRAPTQGVEHLELRRGGPQRHDQRRASADALLGVHVSPDRHEPPYDGELEVTPPTAPILADLVVERSARRTRRHLRWRFPAGVDDEQVARSARTIRVLRRVS